MSNENKNKPVDEQETPVTPETEVQQPVNQEIVNPDSEAPETPVTPETEVPTLNGEFLDPDKFAIPAKEDGDDKDTEKPTDTEPAKTVTVNTCTVIKIRYAASFANKRFATVRTLPLYNILSIYIHNRGAFIGLTKPDLLEAIGAFIVSTAKLTIEGVRMSDDLKKNFLMKLKTDTDYVKTKWGVEK